MIRRYNSSILKAGCAVYVSIDSAMQPSSSATPQNLTRKTLAGAGWSSLSVVARQILSFASVALLARLLGPAAYGLIGMAALVTAFLVNFRDLGTAAAVVQRPVVSQSMLSTLFWGNLILGLLLNLIVIAMAFPAAIFFHEPRLTAILCVLSLSFWITSAGAVHNALLTREMEMGKNAIVDLGSAVAGYLVALPCALAGMGVWSLVFANLANAVGSTILNWFLCRWSPSYVFNKTELRSIRNFSLNLSGFGLVNYFSRNADNVIIGRLLGSGPLGYYQMAYNLMLFPLQNISSVLAQVLFPAFARIQTDDERFSSAYMRSCMLIGLITFPVMAGLGVVADPLVRTLLGSKWVPIIPVFQILAPVGMLQSVQTTVGQIYIAKGRTDWMFRWGLSAAFLYVIAFLIGVRYGIRGVALSYAIVHLGVLAYPSFAIPFRLIHLEVGVFARQLLPQLAITLAMTAACALVLQLLTNAADWVRLTVAVNVGIVVYVAGFVIFRPVVVQHVIEVLAHSESAIARHVRGVLSLVERRQFTGS